MKTHPLNVTYLVVGLVFLGIAGSWALQQSGLVVLDDAEWLLPLMLVAAGVIGLVAAAAKGLRRRDDDRDEYDAPYGTAHDRRRDDTEGDIR